MKICGLQKLSLLDYPERLCATVFLGGCNFRCPFCHNASIAVSPESCVEIPSDELFGFLSSRRGLLDGVCVTGGEPLLWDVEPLLRKIKELGFLVKLDTNGSYPERLRSLVDMNLVDYVAMDIKNQREKYDATAGVAVDIASIERSAELLMRGAVQYEFRTTVAAGLHTVEDIRAIGRWLRGASLYCIQGFVDSGSLIHGEGLSPLAAAQLIALREAAEPYFERVAVRGM